MRILVTGHRGQLGSELMRQLDSDEHTVKGISLPEYDITNQHSVRKAFELAQPQVVLHVAALTLVDYCAEHPDEAMRVNAGGTENVALACKEAGVPMMYVSTNEVFDGQSEVPYRENDQTNPINAYGASKLAGEQAVQQHLTDFWIARTAWLYAPSGTNFVHKIVARAREGQPLRVVDDEVGSPTYVPDLAVAIVKLMGSKQYGIYHMVNAGECSRYEFALAILLMAGLSEAPIEAINNAEFERASTPPPYSPLVNVRGAQMGIELRRWQDALAEFVSEFVIDEAAS